MRKLAFAALMCLLVGSPSWAAGSPWKDAPGAAAYPDADAIILHDVVKVQVRDDGSYDLTEHDAIRILTEDGLQRFGRTQRVYNQATESVSVAKATVWLPDGKERPVPPQQITDDLDAGMPKDGPYAQVRDLTVDYGHLPAGAVVEFEITTHHKAGRPVWETSFFQDVEPILDSTFEVSFPASHPLTWLGTGSLTGVAPQDRVQNGRHTWTWHVAKSDPLMPESGMPAVGEVTTKVMVSSTSSWNDVAAAFQKPWDAVLSDVSSAKPWLGTVQAKAGESRTQAIARTVLDDSTELPFDLGVQDWAPLPLQEVLSQKELSPVDRAELLVAVLRADGQQAWPALLSSDDTGRINKAFPTAQNLTAVAVAVPDGHDGYSFIPLGTDTGGYNALPGALQGQDALVLRGPQATWVETAQAPPEANRESVRIEARLDSEGTLDELIQMRQYGAMDAIWRNALSGMDRDEHFQMFQNIAASVGQGATVRNYFIPARSAFAEPLNMEVSVEMERALQQGGLRLPFLPDGRLRLLQPKDGTSPRHWPVDLEFSSLHENALHFVLPEGYKAQGLPAAVHVKNAIGTYDMVMHTQGRHVWALSRMWIRKPQMAADEFPLLLALIQAEHQAEGARITLSK
ncbi:MAG: DUF3857 domain-containing protein [Candidatus Xenobia bacterium]